MGMKSIIEKNKKKRQSFKKNEIKQKVFKYLYFNEYLNKNVRILAKKKHHEIHNFNSKVSIRNSCIISGRKNSVFKKYKLSRIELKKSILNGKLPGFIKV